MEDGGTARAKEHRVVLAGPAPEAAAWAALLGSGEVREAFPWLRLAGALALAGGAVPPGVPGLADAAALERAEPDIVLDLHSDPEASRALRAALPGDLNVLDARGAGVLGRLLAREDAGGECRLRLFRARAFLTTVLDGMKEDILLLDRTGRIVDCNRNVLEHQGRAREEIIGLHCSDLEGGNFCRRSRRECPFEETLFTKAKAEAVHTRLDDDGRLMYFRIYTYPLFDEFGDLANVVEMRRDITQRTYTEQRLQEAQKMAAIGELSTYMAHEIRNPLFAIGGFARSLLRTGGLDEEAAGKVGIILEEAKRLDGILTGILNYARPGEAPVEEVDVNLVAGETAQLMSIGCDHEGIALETHLGEDVPKARCVPEQLKQCLINLVKNSMEAMEDDGGRIVLSTGLEGGFVFVRVEDDGRGIPDAVKIKAFTPFFSTKSRGSGLGLAMTRKIVEDVGGRVTLTSREGLGTAVTLHMPPALAVDGGALNGGGVPA